MTIAIVGMGALGGVIAWHLVRAGHRPVIIARPETAALLKRDGLTVRGPGLTARVELDVTDNASSFGPCELVLVGLKAHDWPHALPLITPVIGADTTIVPMLNGIPWWYTQGLEGPYAGRRITTVDSDGLIGRTIAAQHVLGCVVYTGAARTAPTHVDWNGRQRMILGEPLTAPSTRLARTVSLLAGAGLAAEPTTDIRREMWMKLLGNTSYNPLSVVSGATMGQIAGDPHLRGVARSIMVEMVEIARRLGIPMDIDIDQRLSVNPAMRDFKTSMLQDFQAGRSLETGAIVDAVVELGRWVGVATPTIEGMAALVAERVATRPTPLPHTTNAG
jgi:2-dehydropantoate 2-reductase